MQKQISEGTPDPRLPALASPAPSKDESQLPSASVPLNDHQQTYNYYRQIFKGHPLPLAYLDLDVLAQNIQQIAASAAGKHIRLASKSLRSVAVLRHILAADHCFQGIMCFTAAEALYLAAQGFDDLLIGYPTWHEQDIAAIAVVVATGTQITLMVDCLEHIEHIENVARHQGVCLPVCLEIDMSMDLPGLHFGVWRSKLRKPEHIQKLIEHITASSHLRLDGIMGYEAQIAGIGDSMPGQRAKNMLVRQLKRRSQREIMERRAAVVEYIQQQGFTLRFVNGGGTGSLASTSREAVVTEITVGSGFYAPVLFDYYRDFRYQPAAGYAIEIVRHPQPAIYTCLGGGYIASGAVGPEKQPLPYLPYGARLDAREGAGEVQTPIHYRGPIQLSLGDPILMRHSKAGELCERFNHLLLISQGAIVEEVTTYRGDGKDFL